MPNPVPGDTLGGYRIDGAIGAGSMGEVFRATDVGLGRKVAIKILSEKHRDSHELRQRFVREGRAVAAVSHPNVVQVFTTGTFDDRPYIAMEFLDGTDLGSLVEKQGPLDGARAARAVYDAAQGLMAASKAGLIHRDVKPANLVLLTSGTVKVTDFGLAKPVDPGSEPALTAMGVVVGTPDYIAPEQARGEPIDERVDIYALGGSLYYLLVGIPPFRTGRPADDKYLKVVARHLRQPAPEAAVTRPGVDKELSNLARTLMAKKPAERPSYPGLLDQLDAIASRLDGGGGAPEKVTRERSRPAIVTPPASAPPRAATQPPPAALKERVSAQLAAGDTGATQADLSAAGLSTIRKPAIPAWLWAFSAMSLAVFVIGLVLYLGKKEPSAKADGGARGSGVVTPPPSASTGATGGAATTAPAPPAAPVVPAGMLLVTHLDGTPWLLVDAKPVALGDYRGTFPNHHQPSTAGSGDADPVAGVPLNFARAYAKARGGHVMSDEEWGAAARTPGFVTGGKLDEWVDNGEGTPTRVRHAGDDAAKPAPSSERTLTFRIAKPAP